MTFPHTSGASIVLDLAVRSSYAVPVVDLATDVQQSARKRPRVFYGWWIVFAGAFINLYFIGAYSFTAFFSPMRQELGLSATALSLPLALRGITGLLQPFFGSFIDRYGPRKLMIAGAVAAGTGSIWLSRVNSLPGLYGAVMLMSLGITACSGLAPTTAVANWFKVKMGKATSIVMTGLGLGGVLVPLLIWLIDAYTWRTASLLVGIGTLVICVPLALVFRHKPECYGCLPDGAVPQPQNPAVEVVSSGPSAPEFSAREAMRTRALWFLAIASALNIMPVIAIQIHIIPFLDQAVFSGDSSKAGMVVTAIAVLSVTGRFMVGWMAGRWDQSKLFALMLLSEAVAMFTFAYTRSVWMLIPFLMLYAPTQGGAAILKPTILREFFGRKSFGAIMGMVFMLYTVAQVVALPLAGWLVDTQGDYTLAWIIFGIIAAVAMLLALLLKPPTSKPGAQQVGS